MCRSIKTLRRKDVSPTDEEVRAAALQFVRKVSGRREPPTRNPEPFVRGVEEIAAATERLLDGLGRPR